MPAGPQIRHDNSNVGCQQHGYIQNREGLYKDEEAESYCCREGFMKTGAYITGTEQRRRVYRPLGGFSRTMDEIETAHSLAGYPACLCVGFFANFNVGHGRNGGIRAGNLRGQPKKRVETVRSLGLPVVDTGAIPAQYNAVIMHENLIQTAEGEVEISAPGNLAAYKAHRRGYSAGELIMPTYHR